MKIQILESDGNDETLAAVVLEDTAWETTVKGYRYLKSNATLHNNARPKKLKITTDTDQAFVIALPAYPEHSAQATGYTYPKVELNGSPVRSIRIALVSSCDGKRAADTRISGALIEIAEEP
jgi:hypothetical protein